MRLIDALNENSLASGRIGRKLALASLVAILSLYSTSLVPAEDPPAPVPTAARMIGATTMITEVSSGLPLPARVDTGATSCSIHCESFKIKDAKPNPQENIGKPIRILIKNKDGKGQWVLAKVVDHVTVRTSEREDERYKVRLKLRWEDVEKKVLVTLNDREKMKYPLLLGRNFLQDDFLVNVGLDANE